MCVCCCVATADFTVKRLGWGPTGSRWGSPGAVAGSDLCDLQYGDCPGSSLEEAEPGQRGRLQIQSITGTVLAFTDSYHGGERVW